MKKIYLYSLILLGIISCKEKKSNLTCERINYLINTKQNIAKQYWSDFSTETLFGPMLYYTREGLYTINANQKLSNRLKIKPVSCKSQNYNLGYVSKIIDTTNFHMNVSYDGQDTTALYYKNTLAMFSDIELTEKFIPDVKDTEEWMSMVIHETFHQYQRSFNKFRTYQVESQKEFDRDTLNYYYKKIDWFKQDIIRENKVLLDIINETNEQKIRNQISTYLEIKKIRIKRIKKEFEIDIFPLENTLSRSEGTARYIEYCVKRFLKIQESNASLKKIDSKYLDDRFKDYSLENDKWMYNLGGMYFYSIGFNLTRVLEKLNIDYQNSIFLENKSFEHYLYEYIK